MSDHKPKFWSSYVFSVDHKVIGLQYLITSFIFLLIGFTMILFMRWQMAFPGTAMPILSALLPGWLAPGGVLGPEGYNQFGAMHGTIMVFLGIVPLGVGSSRYGLSRRLRAISKSPVPSSAGSAMR